MDERICFGVFKVDFLKDKQGVMAANSDIIGSETLKIRHSRIKQSHFGLPEPIPEEPFPRHNHLRNGYIAGIRYLQKSGYCRFPAGPVFRFLSLRLSVTSGREAIDIPVPLAR